MIVFIVFLVLFTGIFLSLLTVSGNYWAWMVGYMWSPGLAALVAARWGRGARISGWQWGRLGPQIASVVLPVAYGLVAYGLAWWTGLVEMDAEALATTAGKLGLPASSGGWSLVAVLVPLTLAGTISNIGSSLGEEMGWRGFLQPGLRQGGMGLIGSSLLVGLVWAVWHYPLILMNVLGSGPFPWLVFIGFTATVIGLSLMIGVLRERSGSLWPAVLFHSAHNAVILSVFDRLTVSSDAADRYLSEAGLLFAGVVLTFGVGSLFLYSTRSTAPCS